MGKDHSRSARAWGHALPGYALSAIVTGILLLACHLLNRFTDYTVTYLLLFPVVACAAWYLGVGPALLAFVLSLAGMKYWFIAPVHSLRIPETAQSVSMLAFLLSSGAVIAMGEVRRRHNARLQKGQAELEDRVRQRTAELDLANQNLRDLSARLLQLQDDERRRIARELHDSVGQLLVGLSMNLSAVRADIERLTETATTITDSEALVQEMSKEVRTISHLLHPPLLDEAGLASAVRWYTEGFAQRSKITVDLDISRDFPRFSRELETAIFRVVQECLTNVHRHSGSSTAKIRLRHLDGHVVVEIEDKGKGIEPEKLEEMSLAGTPGVGIRGMRERLRQLGGSLDINSSPSGTVVVARVPESEASSVPSTLSFPGSSATAAA